MAFTFELVADKCRTSVNSDGRLVKSYTRQYLCKSTTELTLDQVGEGVGILPGAPHPNRTDATCHDIDISRRPTKEPHCAWDAIYTYGTDSVVPENDSDTDPLQRRVKRRTAHVEQQKFIIKDRNDVLITDTAGSPFDGGVPVIDFLGTMTFERDEAHSATSMSQAAILTGKINSDVFMGCAVGTLMLKVTGEEKWEGTYHYWTFVYEMTYDKDGWQPKPANAGLYQVVLEGADLVRERILESDGRPTQEPQPLTVGGGVVAFADRPDDCNFITVDHYITLDFSSLGLPTT